MSPKTFENTLVQAQTVPITTSSPVSGGITSSPSQEVNFDICSAAPNGGDEVTGFEVPHPQICNAFYTCNRNYIYAPCTFCPEHMYFSLVRCLTAWYSLSTSTDLNYMANSVVTTHHTQCCTKLCLEHTLPKWVRVFDLVCPHTQSFLEQTFP